MSNLGPVPYSTPDKPADPSEYLSKRGRAWKQFIIEGDEKRFVRLAMVNGQHVMNRDMAAPAVTAPTFQEIVQKIDAFESQEALKKKGGDAPTVHPIFNADTLCFGSLIAGGATVALSKKGTTARKVGWGLVAVTPVYAIGVTLMFAGVPQMVLKGLGIKT